MLPVGYHGFTWWTRVINVVCFLTGFYCVAGKCRIVKRNNTMFTVNKTTFGCFVFLLECCSDNFVITEISF